MRVKSGDISLHVLDEGPKSGPPIVFAHALATDMHLWDDVVALLPKGLRIIRMDMRGHGLSDVPPAPYKMGQLIKDAETVLDQLNVRDAVFVGVSVGGMIAQGLAVKRLDQIRGLVLASTAAKIGMPHQWEQRLQAAREHGMVVQADGILDRWLPQKLRHSDIADRRRAQIEATDIEGYCGVGAAISGTDFYTPTSGLRLPCLGIAGSHDRFTPPDLVRETIDVIRGSKFELMRQSGHLPPADAPEKFASLLSKFLQEIGHI